MLGLGDLLATSVYHSQAVAGVMGLAAAWIIVNALLSLIAETFRGFKQFWPATLYSGLAVDILLVVGSARSGSGACGRRSPRRWA